MDRDNKMVKQKTYNYEELVDVKNIGGYLEIKGKYYENASKDGKPVLVEVPKKKVEIFLKQAKELAKYLQENLDGEKVLLEIFAIKYDAKMLDELYKTTFKSKKNYKPKTREGHCVDMKVGNHIIPIID